MLAALYFTAAELINPALKMKPFLESLTFVLWKHIENACEGFSTSQTVIFLILSISPNKNNEKHLKKYFEERFKRTT